MKNIKEKNMSRHADGFYEWIKYKIYQIVGIILILFSLFLYFSLYFFEFQDYGNPYLSAPK